MTPRRMSRVEGILVIAISDVDASVSCDGVRVDGLRWCNAVFPFFLHFGVHYQEGVVGEVDGDLAF